MVSIKNLSLLFLFSGFLTPLSAAFSLLSDLQKNIKATPLQLQKKINEDYEKYFAKIISLQKDPFSKDQVIELKNKTVQIAADPNLINGLNGYGMTAAAGPAWVLGNVLANNLYAESDDFINDWIYEKSLNLRDLIVNQVTGNWGNIQILDLDLNSYPSESNMVDLLILIHLSQLFKDSQRNLYTEDRKNKLLKMAVQVENEHIKQIRSRIFSGRKAFLNIFKSAQEKAKEKYKNPIAIFFASFYFIPKAIKMNWMTKIWEPFRKIKSEHQQRKEAIEYIMNWGVYLYGGDLSKLD